LSRFSLSPKRDKALGGDGFSRAVQSPPQKLPVFKCKDFLVILAKACFHQIGKFLPGHMDGLIRLLVLQPLLLKVLPAGAFFQIKGKTGREIPGHACLLAETILLRIPIFRTPAPG